MPSSCGVTDKYISCIGLLYDKCGGVSQSILAQVDIGIRGSVETEAEQV